MDNPQYTEAENKIIDSIKKVVEETVTDIKKDNEQFYNGIKKFGKAWINMQYELKDLTSKSVLTWDQQLKANDFIKNMQVEAITYLIQVMEKEIPRFTTNDNNKPTLINDIKTTIAEEIYKLHITEDQRQALINGIVTYNKPKILITSTENKIEDSPVVQDFSNTLSLINDLDNFKLNQKFNLMSNNEITKTVNEAGQIFAQEVKEGKIDLNGCFEKFSSVWYAIPFTREKENIYLETLKEFRYSLADKLPEYSIENEGKKDLANEAKQDLAMHLVNVEYCNAELRNIVIMAITDFDKVVTKKFVKPDLNKNETSSTKLKNN